MINRIRILIIEDDPIIRELMYDVLADDYEVEVAQDALMGLKLLRRHHHQLLLLDLGLPGDVDGPALVRLIRASNEGIAHMPIVIASAYPEWRRQLPEGSVSGFIAKPFLIETMLRVIAAAFRI